MNKNILMIDDDKILSKATKLRLEKRGYTVELVHSGEEGLRKSVTQEFGLILLDIEMPNVNGLDVLKSIRKVIAKNILPVIMVSSNEENEDVVEALNLGANDYVSKPVNMDVLNARIDTQLEIAILTRELIFKKEIEAMNALITTYNHEINNPLTISFGMLDRMKRKKEYSEETCAKMKVSLERIRDIVQKIRKLSENQETDFEEYVKSSKMIKL